MSSISLLNSGWYIDESPHTFLLSLGTLDGECSSMRDTVFTPLYNQVKKRNRALFGTENTGGKYNIPKKFGHFDFTELYRDQGNRPSVPFTMAAYGYLETMLLDIVSEVLQLNAQKGDHSAQPRILITLPEQSIEIKEDMENINKASQQDWLDTCLDLFESFQDAAGYSRNRSVDAQAMDAVGRLGEIMASSKVNLTKSNWHKALHMLELVAIRVGVFQLKPESDLDNAWHETLL